MAKKKLRKLKKGEEAKIANASPEFMKQLQEIKKLPDDCFTYLPDSETVVIPLNGEFVNALRLGLEHLMESEESFRVVRALYRIKSNFKQDNGKEIPPNKITRYETLMWAVMTLINTITAAAVAQKKSRVADKAEWFHAFSEALQIDKREEAKGADPLDETELANRMGMRINERGDLVLDKDYLAQHDMTNPEVSHEAEDILTGRFGLDPDNIPLDAMEPEHYPIPIRKQKGMKGKMEKW